MRFAILVFPGTWSDGDCQYALRDILGHEADLVWHQERDLSSYDCLVLPGGFSYGDYLRAGAIARFAPAMEAVARHADVGKPVIGICNGFQILCEAQLLPGVLRRNQSLQYRCQWIYMRTERVDTPFTGACRPGQVLAMPISHGEGCYYADEATLTLLESASRVTAASTTSPVS
jgi:phosphoribosylformylglycinamidine synthase